MVWPVWWEWPVECDNPHLLKRMKDRGFTELDLREMLANAIGWHVDHVPGRFAIRAVRQAQPWIVIVEPEEYTHTLVVVTAYAIDVDDVKP